MIDHTFESLYVCKEPRQIAQIFLEDETNILGGPDKIGIYGTPILYE